MGINCEDEHHCICSLYNTKQVAGDIGRIVSLWRFYVSKGYLTMAYGYVQQKAIVYDLANWYRRHRWLEVETQSLCGRRRLQTIDI